MILEVTLDPGATMPTRAHKTDAGLDLYSRETAKIAPFGSKVFDTGVHVAIPRGYVGDVKSKSGLMMQEDITTDGTVDCGYTGSIRVKLFNHGSETAQIVEGQKIAQLVIKKIITPEPTLVDSLEETERGTGGFGSTGKF
jgi:dUTP pyrophosphatase